MPGSGRDAVVRLYRDSLSTPWGFRLQGGKDLKQALSVQKVTLGSPAYGELQTGDMLLEIQNCDAAGLSHSKAQEMIKNAGGSLLLRVRRTGGFYTMSPPPEVTPMNMSSNVGIAPHILPHQGGFMMHRLQDTLTGVLLGRASNDRYSQSNSNNNSYSQTYPRGGGKPRAQHTNSSSHDHNLSSNSPSNTGQLSKPWRPPSSSRVVHPALPSGLAEPGWMPSALKTGPGHQRPATGHHQQQRQQQHQSYARPQELPVAERPAWEGSLRSSGVPVISDKQPQISSRIAHYTPSSAPGSLSPTSQDGYRAANLQYNSPMGMYSREAVNEVLTGQLGSAGPAISTRDSDLYRMVHDNDRQSKHQNGRGVRLGPGHPADNHAVQSPSMNALEAQYVRPEPSSISDF